MPEMKHFSFLRQLRSSLGIISARLSAMLRPSPRVKIDLEAEPPIFVSVKCRRCGKCAAACPCGCIKLENDPSSPEWFSMDTSSCIACGLCEKACPEQAISSPAGGLPPARHRHELCFHWRGDSGEHGMYMDPDTKVLYRSAPKREGGK